MCKQNPELDLVLADSFSRDRRRRSRWRRWLCRRSSSHRCRLLRQCLCLPIGHGTCACLILSHWRRRCLFVGRSTCTHLILHRWLWHLCLPVGIDAEVQVLVILAIVVDGAVGPHPFLVLLAAEVRVLNLLHMCTAQAALPMFRLDVPLHTWEIGSRVDRYIVGVEHAVCTGQWTLDTRLSWRSCCQNGYGS